MNNGSTVAGANALSLDPSIRQLADCDCCGGLGLQAPEVIYNRPGLSSIRYRIGTHSRFKATMLARLSSADLPSLHGLTMRSDSDFTIVLLDAWAAAADVITFYQERIANEAFLRTATERCSLAELANLIGYIPRPGVAASVYLAFTLEETGTPGDIPVPNGTRVQSIPGPGARPQIFETVEAVAGRTEWNAMRPLLVQKHPGLTKETKRVTLRGTATNLNNGDSVLILVGAGPANREVKRVLAVTPNPVSQITTVDLAEDPPDPPPLRFIYLAPVLWNTAPVKLTTTAVKTNILAGSWKQADLKAYAAVQKWSLPKLSLNIVRQAEMVLKFFPPEEGIFALRQRASIFGHNAPQYKNLAANFVTTQDGTRKEIDPLPYPDDWETRTLGQEPGASAGGSNAIDLDQPHPGIVKGSWLVLETSNNRDVYTVLDNTEISRADHTLSSKVSRVKLDTSTNFNKYTLRNTTVLAQSEKLELAELPVTDTVKGNRIVLDRAYLGLEAGRPVVVTGLRTDLDGVTDSEVMILADVGFNQGRTELIFVNDLANEYERKTCTVNANVARATHGETKVQALGSGDGSRAFQKFVLPEHPLTFVPADTAQGAASTLQVRINQLMWQEVPFFYAHGPDEHIYITRTDDEGKTSVIFGDGRTGARVPTAAEGGGENVGATYRKGSGAEGLVAEGQLSLLITRPLGLREVTNPVAAGDSADPESSEDIRRNAALPIRTLDRIVSLRDYEDFSRAFSGIAKALATWAWNGRERGVFVTVAGLGGKPIEPGSITYANLLKAAREAGDPTVPIRLKTYRAAFFRLSGKLGVDRAYIQDAVKEEVEAALRTRFSFDAREFGQPVAKSEVIAAIQGVKGVLAVDLDELHRVDAEEEELKTTRLFDTLASQVPGSLGGTGGSTATLAAELLLLDPRPLELGTMAI